MTHSTYRQAMTHRAEAEGLDVTFEVADAEALQYPDASFDVVLSTFGVMFAPDHEHAASELMRVCRPGGRIGLAPGRRRVSWENSSASLPGTYRQRPGVRSPLLWGTDAHCQDLFKGAATIAHTARHFAFRYRSPEHWVDVFRAYYGPVHKAFAALEADRQAALEEELIALLRQADRGGRPASSCRQSTWRP